MVGLKRAPVEHLRTVGHVPENVTVLNGLRETQGDYGQQQQGQHSGDAPLYVRRRRNQPSPTVVQRPASISAQVPSFGTPPTGAAVVPKISYCCAVRNVLVVIAFR